MGGKGSLDYLSDLLFSFKSLLCKYLFYPLYYIIYLRHNSYTYYNFLNKNQWNTLNQNYKIQSKLLYSLVDYASKEIPYYARVVKERKLTYSEDSIREDLTKFPILTKDIIRTEFDNMYKISSKNKAYLNFSGGSTGEPIKLYQDMEFKSKMLIIKRLQKEWSGWNVGDVVIRLWGSEKDILNKRKSLFHLFFDWINSTYILNSFCMSETEMGEYVGFINKRKPKLIIAYANSINELSSFIIRNNLKVYSPSAIISSAGILYSSFRDNITKAFNCEVFDRYGSRELGDIACECEKHVGKHICSFIYYVEILDDKLNPCKDGGVGGIYLTLLSNYTMPLIRYKIGDMGSIFKDKKCACGRGFPFLDKLVGRDTDVFVTKDKKIIPGELFIHFIGVVYNNGSIRKFQVIQEEFLRMTVKIVLNDKFPMGPTKDKINNLIKKYFGDSCLITWEFVEDILPSKSGKYRYTIRLFDINEADYK